MRIPGFRPQTAPPATMNPAIEPPAAIDPATLEGLQAMDAAHASLRHQLQTGEMAQDAYEEAWTDLIATAPPAVLKASMEKRPDAVQHDAVQHDAVPAGGEKSPGVAKA